MTRLLLALLLGVSLSVWAQESGTPEVSVIPQPDGSALIIVPPETVRYCMEHGGCRIVTAAGLMAWEAEVRKSCGPNI